ncbi:hypothetical protein ACF0H5_018697 [Mactra antiquata]
MDLQYPFSNPQVSLTEVIAAVTADTDADANGFISEAEFRNELLAKFDSDVPSDEVVSKTDFVNSWTKLYNDNHHDAALFFDNLDTFLPFGQLSEVDLLFHMGLLDPDGDGQVAVADFGNFIRQMHPCSAHGHLGC